MVTLPPANPKPRVVGVRQTEPQGYSPYAQGGYSVIPRREWRHDLCTAGSLGRFAVGSPLRLLKLLPDIDPAAGLALWNALRLSCAPGDLTIIATGAGKRATDAANASLDALWKSLPSEVGGLTGLQNQLTQEAFLTGLVCVEGVPGKRLSGLAEVWPVDSLSILFRRDPETGQLIPHQRQFFPKGPQEFGYTRLDAETFFWHAVDAQVDDPYGRAPYAPAISEVLADIAMMKDVRDAVKNGAWPRLAFGFNFSESYKVATEVMNLVEPEASKWVQERFNELLAATGNLNPDDNISYDAAGDVKPVSGGIGEGLDGILAFLRQRITQAFKSLPTLMGINDGSTQTYTTVEWKIYTAGLESIRDLVSDVIVRVANLHLRLLGSPCTAEAQIERIQTTEALMDAQAETIKIQNNRQMEEMGWITRDQACRNVTGEAPALEEAPVQVAPQAQGLPQAAPEEDDAS